MNEINNLIYALEINFTNNSGVSSSITVKFHDNGLEIKSVRVGNVCITEETINGRVLSGKLENLNGCCGYIYDYQNGGNLLNVNPQIPIDTAISLINKKKMETDFLLAKLILSSILRGDYRVVMLNSGKLTITKTISAYNEKSEYCSLQECATLLKLDGEEMFVEQDNKRTYRIDDNYVFEGAHTLVDRDIKYSLIKLSAILSENPKNYKELVALKNQIQKNIISNSINGNRYYE